MRVDGLNFFGVDGLGSKEEGKRRKVEVEVEGEGGKQEGASVA